MHLRTYVVAASMAITALLAGKAVRASEPAQGHLGVIAEAAAEFGGDNVAKVFYVNGSTQDIKAGQGLTPSIGIHYHFASAPFDLAATVGYKFVRTSDYHTDLGIDRVVFKVTGTYELPNYFWIDAGPVWHTSTKFNGDGYLPDVSFGDAVGGTVGFGWRWIGISYTGIRYTSAQTGGIDASSVGVTFAWRF